jgi:tripartite-type tricarboxylate transporter receptor subunit TctC
MVGLYARPGIPQPILDKITAEAIAAANSPAAEKQMRAAGIEPAGGDAAALDRALKREIAKVNEVVKTAGIEPQ